MLPCRLNGKNQINPFKAHETKKYQNKASGVFLFCVFGLSFCCRDFSAVFDPIFLHNGYGILGFYGEPMKQPKKKKPSKLIKALEEGDLFFNLVVTTWFLGLGIVFGNAFKLWLPYKTSQAVYFSLISVLSINLIFKIVDVYMIYSKEPIEVKIHREIEEKRKLMPKP